MIAGSSATRLLRRVFDRYWFIISLVDCVVVFGDTSRVFSDAIVKADLVGFMFEIKLITIHFIGGGCYVLVEGFEVIAWILYNILVSALLADWIMESVIEVEIVLDSHLAHFQFVIIAILR